VIADRELFRIVLRNDLRLWWRGTATKKAAWATSVLGRIAVLALLHLVVWSTMATLGASSPRGGPEFACLLVLSLVSMTALHRSLEVLYDRGDLPLLLASPVPPRIVLRTRLVGIAATTVLDSLTITLPIVNVAILTIGARWAFGFVALLGVAATIVPAAVLLTVVTVERIGARRARTALQILGVLFGMTAFLASQLPQWSRMSRDRTDRAADARGLEPEFLAWFDVPPLQQLAAAAHGAWQWLVPLLVVGSGLFFVAQRSLATRFVHGAQGAAADTGGAPRGGARGVDWERAFRRTHGRTLVRTQFLLLRRDPLLLVRCGMQIVSFVPMLLGAFMVQRAAGIGGVALMAGAIVPMHLAAMRAATDEGQQFEATSPRSLRERTWIRAVATALPLIVFAWVMAVVLAAMGAPLQGAMAGAGGTLNALGAGWLATCRTRPFTAEERARNRHATGGWRLFSGMLIAGVGTAGLGMVTTSVAAVGWIVFALALGLAALQFLAQPLPPQEDG